MTTVPDSDLLRQFTRQGDDAAFAEVVRRHTDFVYSVAWRVAGDATMAQDVTQTVFLQLARQARMLGGYPTLAGWLHTTTRHAAINAVRTENRRRAREQEAFAMNNLSATSEAKWDQLRPILDEAVSHLREGERQAVLLRFFNGLSHQEVGAVLGLSENSANQRIGRALEKLRVYFARRGVTISSALLAAAMTENSVQAAPPGLAGNAATTSLGGAGGALAGGAWLAVFFEFFMLTKTKIILASVVVLILLAALIIKLQTRDAPAVAANPPVLSVPPSAVVIAAARNSAIGSAMVPPPKIAPPADGSVRKSSPSAPQTDLPSVSSDPFARPASFNNAESNGSTVGKGMSNPFSQSH